MTYHEGTHRIRPKVLTLRCQWTSVSPCESARQWGDPLFMMRRAFWLGTPLLGAPLLGGGGGGRVGLAPPTTPLTLHWSYTHTN